LVIALLWVGIGPPFQATIEENHMRFEVLLADAILVACGFVALKEALARAGEIRHSTPAFAAGIFAGTTYILCIGISLAQSIAQVSGQDLTSMRALSGYYDVLEFVACLLTYVATALFVVLLLARGVEFPEISGRTAPWYTRPGVIAGIPAVPWLMPCLLGVVALRSAGGERARSVR
jgi:hypothetical protein